MPTVPQSKQELSTEASDWLIVTRALYMVSLLSNRHDALTVSSGSTGEVSTRYFFILLQPLVGFQKISENPFNKSDPFFPGR